MHVTMQAKRLICMIATVNVRELDPIIRYFHANNFQVLRKCILGLKNTASTVQKICAHRIRNRKCKYRICDAVL